EPSDLPGPYQRERLEQLVHRAVPTAQYHERLRVLDEHRLAREEVPEVDAHVDPLVDALLERQLDAQPHGEPAGLGAALVRGLHDARPAAGDDRVPGPRERRPEPPGQLALPAVR